jgi:HD-GYP domain-containing protein (c-di-GMP phosphodiesterase class II)
MVNYSGYIILILVFFVSILIWRAVVLRHKVSLSEEAISGLNGTILERAESDNLLNMLIELNKFSAKEHDSFDKSKFLNMAVNVASRLRGTDSVVIVLLDSNTNEPFIAASNERRKNELEYEVKFEFEVAKIVLKDASPILVNDNNSDIASKFFQTNDNNHEYKSFIAVPLKVKNKLLGVLIVTALPKDKFFDTKDLNFIAIFANQTAMVYDNLEMYDNLHDFYFDTVKTLARTIDAKDHYTFSHSGRAEQYAKLIAEKLNLSDEVIREIEFAALMHDIGKVGISGHILNKASSLTEDEKEVLKMHPIIGYNILAPLIFLSSVAPIVLYHQEWYNGKGYPEGLSGEEIPLGARIISVIDAYDAMTSDRPYRKALSKEYAVSELEKGMGTQFDPKVAKVFIDILKSRSM